jgi:4-hydroxybenzoate polyprenyltransferase
MGIGTYARLGSVVSVINMAFERIIPIHMYSSMGLLGLLVASRGLGISYPELLPILTVTLSTMGLYVINDVFDFEIDKISHPERSLPQGKVTINQATILGITLLIAGPVIAVMINPVSGLMVGVISVLGITYSVPPIRLRRFPVIPNMMIGLGVFFAFIAGAAFKVPVTGRIVFGALLVFAYFSFQSLIKDLDEGEGDSVGGVMSLPVLFGVDMALKISGVIALSTVIFPVLFIIIFDLNPVFILGIAFLYIVEGYCLYQFAKSLKSPDTEQRLELDNKTLDRPLLNPWLMRFMICFICIQVILLIASLV